MPTYNSVIDRSEADPLVPEEVEQAIFSSLQEQSHVMRLGTRLRNGKREQYRLKVDENLPTAYFVEGDTGLIQTSEASWINKYINYHKLGVIIPISEDVADDADVDIFNAMIPAIAGAFAAKFDGGVIQGTDVPASYTWPTNLAAGCTAAGSSVDLSVVELAGGDLYSALLGENGVVSLMEQDGFEPTAYLGGLTMKGKLRSTRSTTKEPIFVAMPQDATQYVLDGAPIAFPKNGCITQASLLLLAGQWDQLVYSVRKELTFKVLTEGVITDAAGAVIYNFAQQETKGLRVTMRIGWEIPNPTNRTNAIRATRYPFAKLVP